MPAFFLGLVVASIDLVFVNYVVPRFLRATERAVMRDIAGLIVGQISHQEKVELEGKLVVYADSADQQPSDVPDTCYVTLHGMAASLLDRGKVVATAVARQATARITNLTDQDAARIDISVQDGSGFDPSNAFRRATGSVNSISPDGRPLIVPSLLKSKPKFLNIKELYRLNEDPTFFPPVEEIIDSIRDAYRDQVISRHIQERWKAAADAGKPVSFDQSTLGSGSVNELRVYAKTAVFDEKAPADRSVTFSATPQAPVRIEQFAQGRLQSTFTCDAVDVQLVVDDFSGSGVGAALQLRGNVLRSDHIRNIQATPVGLTSLAGIILDPGTQHVPPKNNRELLDYA
jgi:hypothetical protein